MKDAGKIERPNQNEQLLPVLASGVKGVLDTVLVESGKSGVDAAKAREKLRLGTRILVARSIWHRLKTHFSTSEACSQNVLARELNCEQGLVSRGLSEGQLSLEYLSAFMTQLKWNWNDLGSLPTPENRARAGYQHVLQFVRTGLATSAGGKQSDMAHTSAQIPPISTVDFVCLVHLFRSKEWLLRPGKNAETSTLLHGLRKAILSTLSKIEVSADSFELLLENFKDELNRIKQGDDSTLLKKFERLQKDWGRAYIHMVSLVDPPWEI